MADTFTQLSIHATFAVKHRFGALTGPFRNRVHSYIAGILNKITNKSLAVGGWNDHVHIFFELPATKSVSAVLDIVKSNSSRWINDEALVPGHFEWQEGYGALSHSRSQRHGVIQYIMRQEEHHRGKTFREEYIAMLERFEIPYDERYLFDFWE